jgi:hypothetical protein
MATPQQYSSTFDLFGDGRAVLDDLVQKFGAAPFVPGMPDQTAYNCGARAVIEHIHAEMAKADRPAR